MLPWQYFPPGSFDATFLGRPAEPRPHCFEFYQGIESDRYRAMCQWCREHCERWHSLGGSFYFYRDDDAFAFKMRWL